MAQDEKAYPMRLRKWTGRRLFVGSYTLSQTMLAADEMPRFCGVSYLVFSEMKALERKLKATQQKLLDQTAEIEQMDDLKRQIENLRSERNQHREEVIKMKKLKDHVEKEWMERCDAARRDGSFSLLQRLLSHV